MNFGREECTAIAGALDHRGHRDLLKLFQIRKREFQGTFHVPFNMQVPIFQAIGFRRPEVTPQEEPVVRRDPGCECRDRGF